MMTLAEIEARLRSEAPALVDDQVKRHVAETLADLTPEDVDRLRAYWVGAVDDLIAQVLVTVAAALREDA